MRKAKIYNDKLKQITGWNQGIPESTHSFMGAAHSGHNLIFLRNCFNFPQKGQKIFPVVFLLLQQERRTVLWWLLYLVAHLPKIIYYILRALALVQLKYSRTFLRVMLVNLNFTIGSTFLTKRKQY